MKLKLCWGNKRKMEVPQIVLTLGTCRAGMFLESQHCCLPPTCIPAPWTLGLVPGLSPSEPPKGRLCSLWSWSQQGSQSWIESVNFGT